MEMRVRNVNEALPKGIEYLKNFGERRGSRNGDVLVAREPVMTMFTEPAERVLFDAKRDANPFFHFFEALWMLAGRNDVAFVRQFVKRMETFSDDGETLNGAYGTRWRQWFTTKDETGMLVTVDQLPIIAERLKKYPEDRRCVLGMWDPSHDLGLDSKDLPCNTQVYFGINHANQLNMTVCCRSNDLIWGLCGANAVHFSVLHEYMASRIGVEQGRYYHLSNNYHGYLSTIEPLFGLKYEANPYWSDVKPLALSWSENWEKELHMFFAYCDCPTGGGGYVFQDLYFKDLVLPLLIAHRMYKSLKGDSRFKETLGYINDTVADCDWKVACAQWVQRRYMNWSNGGSE